MSKFNPSEYPNRKPKKPKLGKLPKLPKASAGVSTWANYEAKAKAIIESNTKKEREYQKNITLFEQGKKYKESLRQKAKSGLAGFAGTKRK